MKRIPMFLAFVMVVAMITPSTFAIATDTSVTDQYTDDRLTKLYEQYDISENDVKFINNELPNFLDGTILSSEYKVLVTEDGKPLDGMERGKDYDIIITEAEMISIIQKAEADYISTYGVDPSNPKLDIVNGKAIPTMEVQRLIESGNIESADTMDVFNALVEYTFLNPKEVNNQVDLHIYPAAVALYAPAQSYYQDTVDGSERFEQFGTTVNRYWHYNIWNPSGTPTYDSQRVLDDLRTDCIGIRQQDNDLVLGWVNFLDHNGRAGRDDSFSVCAVQADGFDWPHDSIVQHEISHNFGAVDQGYYTNEHAQCIMNYQWAYSGTNVWCTNCGDDVEYGIEY